MLFTNNGKFLKNNGLLLNDCSGPTPPVDPYNPFNLGPGVLRIRMINAPVDYSPNDDIPGDVHGQKGYWQQVDTDIWDWVPARAGLDGDYFNVIRYSFDLMSWNISGFTDQINYCFRNSKIERIVYPIDFSVMSSVQTCDEMFAHSTLYNVPSLIRLPSNESCWRMFFNCVNLREIPQFDWNYKPSNVDLMFGHCVSVEGGMLNFYNHWNTINSHAQCFNQCGVGTQTGSAELAQIPNDWK